MARATNDSRITAVLGPTNTGKTHLAVERMLGHPTGMIGCPLRLLAREIYDRVVAARGRGAVALITGEEKIAPPRARYFICTVEAMPMDRPVGFLAVDEIQLAADPERGHVFTDRLLRARGLAETMFLGAGTIAPLLRRLVPEAEIISRPRFSTLSYAGPRKLTRLKPRSAVVAFSAADVYALAELLRRVKGGAAVVLGALSPRTRNAQVAMFQAGEVDYLVATDAIGMGLNMHVDHIAFAELRKFDGRAMRNLTAAEIAQIAGRAGRHMRDGTFGTTTDLGPLDDDVVAAVEAHEFDTLKTLYWRSSKIDLSSVKALVASLEADPPSPLLIRPREAEDLVSLRALAGQPEIARHAVGYDAVSLLWEVCRIPDFRKTMTDAHVRLLGQIYLHLAGPAGRVPSDWINANIAPLDRTDGDIDTLSGRIAHIRTWNYVAHRADWVDDAVALQARARDIEDKLSDALHDRLTNRFVDRHSAVLLRGRREQRDLAVTVGDDDCVTVEGEAVGRLAGLTFQPADRAVWRRDKAWRGAIQKALAATVAARLAAILAADDADISLDVEPWLMWRGARLARLGAGPALLAPAVKLAANDLLDSEAHRRLRQHLQDWLNRHVEQIFKPLFRARDAKLSGPARGIAFQLAEGLGSLSMKRAHSQLGALDKADRAALTGLGVRFGRESLFLPALLKPARVALRARLWSIYHDQPAPAPPAGRISVPVDGGVPLDFYGAIGYRPLGNLAIRIDIVERLAAALRKRARAGPFPVDGELLALAGTRAEDFAGVLRALGYHPTPAKAGGGPAAVEDRPEMLYAPRRRGRPQRRQQPRPGADATSPFAVLHRLKRDRT